MSSLLTINIRVYRPQQKNHDSSYYTLHGLSLQSCTLITIGPKKRSVLSDVLSCVKQSYRKCSLRTQRIWTRNERHAIDISRSRLCGSAPIVIAYLSIKQHTLLSRVFCPNLFCRLACNGGLWQLILNRSTWLHQGSSIIDHQRHGGRVIEFPRPSRKVYLFIFTQITVSSFRNNHSRRHGCREEDFRRRRIYSRIQVFSRNISNGASFSYMYSN